jgi:hypothetical protein
MNDAIIDEALRSIRELGDITDTMYETQMREVLEALWYDGYEYYRDTHSTGYV